MTDDTRAAPTPEATTEPTRYDPTPEEAWSATPAREASSAPGWDRAVDVADEFVAALAVRNRGSGTEGPRTRTDAYAAWLHLKQVLAASRATVAALIARATFTEQERANYEQAIEALQDRVAALTAEREALQAQLHEQNQG